MFRSSTMPVAFATSLSVPPDVAKHPSVVFVASKTRRINPQPLISSSTRFVALGRMQSRTRPSLKIPVLVTVLSFPRLLVKDSSPSSTLIVLTQILKFGMSTYLFLLWLSTNSIAVLILSNGLLRATAPPTYSMTGNFGNFSPLADLG